MATITAGMCSGIRSTGFTITSRDEIITKKVYYSLTALAKLTDQTCTDLITIIIRPGGTITNPLLLTTGLSLLLPVSNPGIKVGHKSLTPPQTGDCFARHLIHTSFPLDSLVAVLTPA